MVKNFAQSSIKRTIIMTMMGFLLLTSCFSRRQGGEGPKARLQDYISQSFAVTGAQDRESLSRFLTGPAKTRLAAWSDDQFRAVFLENKRQFVKLSISEVLNVSAKEVKITYELTYFDQSKGHEAKVTHKKMAQLTQEDQQWFISEVRNMKELIEYKNEMALP